MGTKPEPLFCPVEGEGLTNLPPLPANESCQIELKKIEQAHQSDELHAFGSVVRSVSWPLTLLIVMLIFKDIIHSIFQKLSDQIPFIEELTATKDGVKFKLSMDRVKSAAKNSGHQARSFENTQMAEPSPEKSALGKSVVDGLEFQTTGILIQSWAKVEKSLRLAYSKFTFESSSQHIDVRHIIRRLEAYKIINREDADVLKAMMNARNVSAHGGAIPSREDAESFFEVAQSIVDKLSAME